MILQQYQVDAFATSTFQGNPAAVCPLEFWLDDEVLQAIAEENNLAETAFFVQNRETVQLRWFTPVTEVEFCGHATLATAHVIFEVLNHSSKLVVFDTKSGTLTVKKHGSLLQMDFPIRRPAATAVPTTLTQALGRTPSEVLAADDYMAVFSSEHEICEIAPDFALLSQLDLRGVIVTAPGNTVDFVSRFFAPKYGVPEDSVTGSAHCELAPYWAERLGRNPLIAKQVSKRGGDLTCEIKGERVLLGGGAVMFSRSTIFIPDT